MLVTAGPSNLAPYIGRFAPSPTGPLHFGSLVTAVASYLDAKSANGQWFVRMEDLDPPREVVGAKKLIVDQLKTHGLVSDQPILYQSARLSFYEDRLQSLEAAAKIYRCSCARSTYDNIYPGRCRAAEIPQTAPHAIRFRTSQPVIKHLDLLQGFKAWRYGQDYGDFVVKRKDGLHAYQLAVVADDIDQNITRIVRGADLFDSTPAQTELYAAFATRYPETLHIPLVLGQDGEKLSKQSRAPTLSGQSPQTNLNEALKFLNQSPVQSSDPAEILRQATLNWQPSRISPSWGRIWPSKDLMLD